MRFGFRESAVTGLPGGMVNWSLKFGSGRRSRGGTVAIPECSVDRSSRPETNRSMRFGFRESAVTGLPGGW